MAAVKGFLAWCLFISVSFMSFVALTEGKGRAACTCATLQLCEPVNTSPVREILGFMTSKENWRQYNWTTLTTLAVFTDMTPQELAPLVCMAHRHHVRVVSHGDYPTANLSSPTMRSAWVDDMLKQVQTNHFDGINIDFEHPVTDKTDIDYLTDLVRETHTKFKAANPSYHVTFDVAWSPKCIDKRCYDYKALAAYTDYLIVMSYDERSQIWNGPCLAGANSPYPTTAKGVEEYFDLGIPANKLILGQPWYGYNYPCLTVSQDGNSCSISKVPFEGAPCSDAAGKQYPYSEILLQLTKSKSGRQYNKTLEAPYFNYKAEDGIVHQVWYDDTQSLTTKYEYAKKKGIYGLAFWNVDSLDYTVTNGHLPTNTTDMWNAIQVFF